MQYTRGSCNLCAEDHDEDEEDEGEDVEEEDTDEDEELGNISAADLRALAAYGRKHGLPDAMDDEDEVICSGVLPSVTSTACSGLHPLHAHTYTSPSHSCTATSRLCCACKCLLLACLL